MCNELNPDKARKQARRAKNRRKRDREKARKDSKKKWDIPLKWEWVLIIALYSWIVYKVTVNTVNSYKLAAYGENQVAYVYAKKKHQARHFVIIDLRLMVNFIMATHYLIHSLR